MTTNREEGFIVLNLQDDIEKKSKVVEVYSTWIVNDVVSYPKIEEDNEDDKFLIKDFLKQKIKKAPENWPKHKFIRLNNLIYGNDKYKFI